MPLTGVASRLSRYFWCRVRESNPDRHPECNFFNVPLTGEVRTRQEPVAEDFDMSLYAIIAKRCVMPRGSVSRRMGLVLALQLMEHLLTWLCAYHKSHGREYEGNQDCQIEERCEIACNQQV